MQNGQKKNCYAVSATSAFNLKLCHEVRRRSAGQFQLFTAPHCPRGRLVPPKSEEHYFYRALLTERTMFVGWGKGT